jgi:hypothetical protein
VREIAARERAVSRRGVGDEFTTVSTQEGDQGMRKSVWIAAFVAMFALALPAKAQNETPKMELYGGYDYVLLNASGSSYNFNGGSGQFVYNPNRWLGIVGDLGGYYTPDGFTGGIFSYLFGPRIYFRGRGRVTPFAQVLVGGEGSGFIAWI